MGTQAFHRLYEQLVRDLQESDQPELVQLVRAGSLSPGVVDTEGVRAHVALADALSLPHAEWFHRLYEGRGDGATAKVLPTDRSADFIWAALTACPAEEFSATEHSVHRVTPWWAGTADEPAVPPGMSRL